MQPVLVEFKEHAMGLLIEFCYTSKIVIDETNVQTLLPAGTKKYYIH